MLDGEILGKPRDVADARRMLTALSYIRTGDPMDKAGAYGIQSGAGAYIQGIAGDYDNVVGLPVTRLRNEMRTIL